MEETRCCTMIKKLITGFGYCSDFSPTHEDVNIYRNEETGFYFLEIYREDQGLCRSGEFEELSTESVWGAVAEINAMSKMD